MWCRVFNREPFAPQPAELLALVPNATGQFRGDDLGWTGGTIQVGEQQFVLERYLTREDDLRGELNTWAAWLESRGGHAALMERVIQTAQLVTIETEELAVAPALCALIAAAGDGIWQADGHGWFAADGRLLLADS